MEKNLGHATAYGYAKSKGYSGTEDEFAELMADYASVGQSAAQSAEQAAASATSASGSAATASQAAQTATSKASEAVTAADTATTKASEASQSASTASAAATSASTSAQIATEAAATATTKASEASESAVTATTAKTDAESARDAAAQSASEAAASAESIDPETLEHKAYGAYVVESASGAIASFADGADNIPMKDVLVHIEPVQAGSGDPSPDNIRPITGWTGAKVTRTGKNLAYLNARELTADGVIMISDGHGKITVTGTHTKAAWHGGYEHFILPPGTYTITALAEGTVSQVEDNVIAALGIATHYLNIRQIGTAVKQTFTLTEPTEYGYSLWLPTGTFDLQLYIQIELGSTATDYEPYSGQTYSITFPTEAGTVYGGTLDVVTGELVVDRAYELLDDVSKWKVSTSSAVDFEYSTNARDRKIYNNSYDGLTCSYAPINKSDYLNTARWTSSSGFVFGFRGLGLSLEQIKADAQAGKISILYDLATPITYALTPTEITSLLGENNFWADTGDSEVEYRADTKMYVDNAITAAISALS